jgi:hypothetical protein
MILIAWLRKGIQEEQSCLHLSLRRLPAKCFFNAKTDDACKLLRYGYGREGADSYFQFHNQLVHAEVVRTQGEKCIQGHR